MPQNAVPVLSRSVSLVGTPKLNITAATVIKASPGVIFKIAVLVAGSAAGSINDCTTTGAAAAANEIFSIPNTTGVYVVEWPCAAGITVVPGTGQTVALIYT